MQLNDPLIITISIPRWLVNLIAKVFPPIITSMLVVFLQMYSNPTTPPPNSPQPKIDSRR